MNDLSLRERSDGLSIAECRHCKIATLQIYIPGGGGTWKVSPPSGTERVEHSHCYIHRSRADFRSAVVVGEELPLPAARAELLQAHHPAAAAVAASNIDNTPHTPDTPHTPHTDRLLPGRFDCRSIARTARHSL